MTETRIQFNQIVDNQVPSYVREEFPLIVEFLSQYYLAQEFKGAPIDLIQNIDRYAKLDENARTLDNPKLGLNIDEFEETITVLFDFEDPKSYAGTQGFPESYGLLKIGNEIITYTGKTQNSFTGCIRGFSGIESYSKEATTDELVFSSTLAESHSAGDEIINVSDLFLKEFLKKTKYQLLPGFEDRNFYTDLNESLFIKQSKDFYAIRGTDESFRILFKALYGEDATIIRPKDYLFRLSDSEYRITNDLVVEPIEGDPLNLKYSYLVQETYGDIIPEGRGPIADVKKISSDYYQISVDSGYNRDILDDGSIYGRFSVHPKTKCIGNISIGATIIDVDSTVGFPNSGELYASFEDNTVGVVSYTSKSINQFFGCSNVSKPILDTTYVGVNTYAYGITFNDEIIKVRITSILDTLDIVDDTYGLSENAEINIKTLGVNPKDLKSNNWIFNNATSYETLPPRVLNIQSFTYEITTKKEHLFRVGDIVLFISSSGSQSVGTVENVNSATSFESFGQGQLNTSQEYTIKRLIKKGNSTIHPSITKYNTDIQNIYKIDDDTLVASSSIPSYYGQTLEPENNSITFGGDFIGDTFRITTNTDHGFYTGDLIYYTPEKQVTTTLNPDTGETVSTETVISSLFGDNSEGLYYVKRVDSNNIKLSKSKSNIYNNIVSSDPSESSYMLIETLTTVSENKIERYNFIGKTLDHQKLFREIKKPQNDGYYYETEPGRTGILINGVEILNYKSKDYISYGSVKEIEVLSGGSNYDVINPPRVEINDKNGTGAVAHCTVSGVLDEIRIIDPGFDYTEQPTISITGGNGSGAVAQASLSLVDHQSFFYADQNSGQVSLASSTIGFSTYHKFRNGESVIYKTDGQQAIGGLSTDATYYVSVQDFYTIKLHKTQEDAIAGVNTVALSSYGSNKQNFKSTFKKSVISSINILNPGFGYQNKQRTVSSSGINTYTNTIEIANHGYESGEIVRYIGIQTNTDTSIGGISTNTNYYVTKIDNDSFKLSQVGSGDYTPTFYYETKQYLELTSSGVGTQFFNYPPITVEVNGTIGIASTSTSTFKAVVQPLFRGEITSIQVSSGGTNYGSDIINFERLPDVTLTDGRNAQFTPIINNGTIVEVLVDNVGLDYLAPPTLNITSETGTDAILTPVLKDGSITEVKVISGGTGYIQGETIINCNTPGEGIEVRPILDKWNVNLFYKKMQNITPDDGVIEESLKYGLQYTHLYAPRKLRETINQIDTKGNKIYGRTDLTKVSNIETDSTNHSPIIGWAYDGNPIYGPYGYAKKSGGTQITRMKSGYIAEAYLKSNRPSLASFPEGFFVEDYTFYQNSDESFLDENNGRFCVTPDFPNGTYAYFATINQAAESSGNFFNYRRPVFPYLIGKSFRSKPNTFNFSSSSNQDDYDLTKTNWKRNTYYYNLINGSSSYEYVNIPNHLKQKSIITSVGGGKVENIDIIFAGDGYKVNDKLVFDEENTSGQNADAVVSRIKGKTIQSVSFASSIVNNVEIYPGKVLGEYQLICENPHQFNNLDSIYLSGFNTTSLYLNGYYNIGISTIKYSLQSGISTASTTGIITSFYISGDISSLRDNDIVSITSSTGTEQIKVLNVYPQESRIRAIRAINGIGVSHFATDIITKNNRDFTINSGFKTSYDYKLNKQIYFNPVESVGLGTTSGVGITSALFFDSVEDLSPIGIGTSTKSIIYFKNSKDYFKYNSGGYVDIVNATSGSFNTTKRKIVAIGETTITLDFDTSSLSGVGVTAYLNKRKFVEIPTKTIYIPNHGLETGDRVIYSSNGGTSLGVSTTGVGSTNLVNGQSLYIAKITDSLVGIATVQVGIGSTGVISGITSATSSLSTLYLVGLGTNVYHSFTTTYPILKGTVSKNKAIVSTAQTHGLRYNDNVYVSVNPSISTSFYVKYDDANRRLVINPRSFTSAEVNTSTNRITINGHGWINGQKVIHTATSPSGGLQNNKIYYVRVVDENTVGLTTSFYESQQNFPELIDITSSGDGVISPINPPISLYKNSTITFDLSDSSLSYISLGEKYSAFDLKIFVDKNETNVFDSSEESRLFNISRVDRVGIDTTAKLILQVDENLPENLYYNLEPVYTNGISLPETKEQIIRDIEVFANNNLQIKESAYNGKQKIIKVTDNTFEYQLNVTPEKSSYISSESTIYYETDSISASSSGIAKIKIINGGVGYKQYPAASVGVSTGKGSEFDVLSKSIGKASKIEIQDIGYDFPSDNTLSPSALVPQLVKIETLSSLDTIGITSVGKGYSTSPSLLLFDGRTNEIVPDVDLQYNLGDSQVTILKNTVSLYNETPTILPIHNSNGVGISSVGFNTTTKDVTVTLSVGFSTQNSFPFSVNDKVLVENIGIVGLSTNGIGIGSTGKNYNSENYNYQLFTLTSVTENLGGIGSVTYNLSEFLKDGESPGVFNPNTSSGRIIPEKHFPQFNITLTKGNYIKGETVQSPSSTGTVHDWDSRTNTLTISSNEYFSENENITGQTSKVVGVSSQVTAFDSFYTTSAKSQIVSGSRLEAGYLNNNEQVLQDGNYYQNFSYSIKSKVDLETWDDVVGILNHTSGYKRFSDYTIESSFNDDKNLTTKTPEEGSDIQIVTDLVSVVDLNCYPDFDLVGENSIKLSSGLLSDKITFDGRILSDYSESIGNRVLLIDDISGNFNSNPRPTNYSAVDRFLLSDGRVQKYVTFVRDRRYTSERQLMLVTLLQANSTGYLNQYARVETTYDLGSFDFSIEGSEGLLLYYPTRYTVNDYDITTLTYRLNDGISGTGSTTLGSCALIETDSTLISGQTTIVGISTAYRSAKVLVEIDSDNSNYEFDELNILHDGTNVDLLEYGQLTSHSLTGQASSSGLGTYYPYISGSTLKVDFIPNTGIGTTVNVNCLYIALADSNSTGVGTTTLNHSLIECRSTTISSSGSPTAVGIASYKSVKTVPAVSTTDVVYQGVYGIVQVTDKTNNRYQLSEIAIADFDSSTTTITEFANLDTGGNLGTIDATVSGEYTTITFTPLPSIDVEVKIYLNAMRYEESEEDLINFNNGSIETAYGYYTGTESDIKRQFNLTHKNDDIFERIIDPSDSSILNLFENTIKLPNHFFVTGEKLVYDNGGIDTSYSIGIGTTNITGYGSTDRLPDSVYAVKVDSNTIKLAGSAENALKSIPETLNFESVGIGTSHTFTSTNQNAKVLVSIDNIIQSPIVSTALTSRLALPLAVSDDIAYFTGITSFFGGDLIRIDSEIMKVEGIGIGSTNAIRVRRPWLGTTVVGHSSDALVTKVVGNYNIVDNYLNFSEAPYGNVPETLSTNPPDERDWVGISTGSSFSGRVFLRSGVTNTTNETYSKNYVFTNISNQFTGINSSFILRSNGSNVSGILSESIILVNDIFQRNGQEYDYVLSEAAGITTLNFVGTARTITSDVGISSFPKGGIIVSVGSTEGFGYQPLVAAGGTAIVSLAGTIQSISIGNSGSGYRSGIQTNVRVGVQTQPSSIQFVGIASISNGHIVSVAITNPGTGYTSSNPPTVVFDSPLSYSNIPLVYSSSSSSGIGTNATIDIVVGQGSSVIDFEIVNTGFGYGNNQTLTVSVGGTVGIPTTSGFKEFKITIDEVSNDKFSGWSIGELLTLDSIEDQFDGEKKDFLLKVNTDIISILSSPGSGIDVQDNLLVFVNSILQVPGEGYLFPGGSVITFTEAPKSGDTASIVFYRGSGDSDVIFRDVLETVKVGDELTIGYDSSIGQSPFLQENPRTVTRINSVNLVDTNPYFGPGNVDDVTLKRPVTWCKQTEDKIIDGQVIGKDRDLYEASIIPSAYIIKSVGVGTTVIYVDSVRPFFNPQNESNASISFQNNVTLTSQDSLISAAATAVVSSAGTISSIVVTDGGVGYTTTPFVSIASTVGISVTTSRAEASATISSGTVIGIAVTNPGFGYTSTNPPVVLIESPTVIEERNSVVSYSGDSGVVVGFGTTTISTNTHLIFDLFIPQNSYLRNPTIVGSSTTLSGISTGDYFIINNSNVSISSTAFNSLSTDGSSIGIGTTFADAIYQVNSFETVNRIVAGVGTTSVSRVFVRVSGMTTTSYSGTISTSSYFGDYSWGKILLSSRTKENTFNFYGNNGTSGITTSAIVTRSLPLRYKNYSA